MSDIENLKTTAIKGLEAHSRLETLSLEYERVKKLVPTMQERIQNAKDKTRLKELESVFNSSPTVLSSSYSKRRNSVIKSRGKKDRYIPITGNKNDRGVYSPVCLFTCTVWTRLSRTLTRSSCSDADKIIFAGNSQYSTLFPKSSKQGFYWQHKHCLYLFCKHIKIRGL